MGVGGSGAFSPRLVPNRTYTGRGGDAGVLGGGRKLYEEQIPSTLGSIQVQSANPHTTWILDGAHFFRGQGSAKHPWATPGRYTLRLEPAFDGLFTSPPGTMDYEVKDSAAPILIPIPTPQRSPTHLETFATPSTRWIPDDPSCWSTMDNAVQAKAHGPCRSSQLRWRGDHNGAWWVMRLKRFTPDNGRRKDGNAQIGLEYRLTSDQDAGYRIVVRPNAHTAQLIHRGSVIAEARNVRIPWDSWSLIAVGFQDNTHKLFVHGRLVFAVQHGQGHIEGAAIWARDGAIKLDDIGWYP